jgi:hypothetical protein
LADIFSEIDEALRQDRAKELWQRHGLKLVVLAVLVVLGIAAWNIWNWHQRSERGTASITFSAAVENASKDRKGSIAALQKLATGIEPYASLARLKIAQLESEAGDHAAAATQFSSIAPTLPSDGMKDLAVLLSVMQSFDKASPDEMQAKLQPLTGRDRPWRLSALEMQAAVAMKRNDAAAARQIWTDLRDDPASTQAMRERAREMIAVLADKKK